MTFSDLDLNGSILKALKVQGYTHPTLIQQKAIPILLDHEDLLGIAQTGTGKTAAFAIPIIQHLIEENQNSHRKIKALVITPTRELAIQISDSFKAYAQFTSLKTAVIFGGVKQGQQVQQLKSGVDILIATPGRLHDLIEQSYIDLSNLKYFVLDEADQMLDMGFVHDIKKLIKLLPKKRQSLFFSATMPKSIVELSKQILGSYKEVSIKPDQPTAERVSQEVYFVKKADKPNLLIHILNSEYHFTTLVFTRTKHGADKVVGKLKKAKIDAVAIHGNKSQNARQRALNDFKEGKTAVLVATDIAARGIDVDDLSLVVNFDLPNVAETYVHRIGRTGRAKASGKSISFCDVAEVKDLKSIQRLTGQDIPVVSEHPYVFDLKAAMSTQNEGQKSASENASNGQSKNRRNKRPYHKRKRRN